MVENGSVSGNGLLFVADDDGGDPKEDGKDEEGENGPHQTSTRHFGRGLKRSRDPNHLRQRS